MMIYWAMATDENTDRQQVILGTSEEAVISNASNRNLLIMSIDYTSYSDLLDFSIEETFEYLCKNEDISDADERTLWKKATLICGGGY
jgi:hypothetical protein|tara:strand:+ start:208 stop:471 length:264 start_codon:yes stop_codon:yes gene_type:complete